jgi:transposase
MSDPHPIELRIRVVEAYESGEGSYPEIAGRFSLGEATVKRWVWLMRETGSVVPSPKGGGQLSTIGQGELDELVRQLGDPTANELTAAFNRRRRRRRSHVHVSSIKRALHRYGYVVKKNADGRWRVCGRTCSTGAMSSGGSPAESQPKSSFFSTNPA